MFAVIHFLNIPASIRERERDREDVKMSYIKNNFQHKVIKHLKARYM